MSDDYRRVLSDAVQRQVRIHGGLTVEAIGDAVEDVFAPYIARMKDLAETINGMPEHPERRCRRCHGPNIAWSAPSPLWNYVMRGDDINGPEIFDGIVCPTCFAVIAEESGVAQLWRVYAERVDVPLKTVTPSGRTWDADAWMWRERDRLRDETVHLHVQLNRIRALHRQYRDVYATDETGDSCAHCNTFTDAWRVPWPCPTIQALDDPVFPAPEEA